MKAWSLGVMVVLSAGCDGFMPGPSAMPTGESPPLEVEPSWRYGTVVWSGLDTDCPDDSAWSNDEVGMVIVEGDEVTLVFETMPPLSGTLAGGRADVAGRVTFMGETGADVTCVVDGDVALGPDGESMEGEMHEALSSDGDLNCTSRARYRLVLDP